MALAPGPRSERRKKKPTRARVCVYVCMYVCACVGAYLGIREGMALVRAQGVVADVGAVDDGVWWWLLASVG